MTSLGAPTRSLGAPGSADDKPGSTWERQRQAWKHLESLYSSLGKMTSLGTLQVRLEIIATTYHATIFETHVFSLYSHLCIYIATHLHSISGLSAGAVLESQLEVRLKMTIKGIQRYTSRP